MMGKFVCPKCGSNLEFWKESIHTEAQHVNAKTGEISKTKRFTLTEHGSGDMYGYQCATKGCGWVINAINSKLTDEENALLVEIESVNK